MQVQVQGGASVGRLPRVQTRGTCPKQVLKIVTRCENTAKQTCRVSSTPLAPFSPFLLDPSATWTSESSLAVLPAASSSAAVTSSTTGGSSLGGLGLDVLLEGQGVWVEDLPGKRIGGGAVS